MVCRTVYRVGIVIFVFKQKTAYEMRISDWSSDVCSSDLGLVGMPAGGRMAGRHADVRRHFRMTAGIGQRTAAGKGAAGAEIAKVRHCARNGRQRDRKRVG